MQIIKQANGIYRWTATSTNNIKDRDGETLSLKALQADVARTKMFGDDDGCLFFYHIPYAIGGAPDYRTLIDGMLLESGEFYDEPVAKAIAEFCINNPDGLDGSGWGTSVGFMGVPDRTGTYNSVLIHERSMLPLSKAANAYTSFGVKNKMSITADQQKALDIVLQDETLKGLVMSAVDTQHQSKMADAEGVVRKAAKKVAEPTPDQPVFKKAGNYTATPQDTYGFSVTKAEGDPAPAQAVAETILDVAEQAIADVAAVVASGAAAPETAEVTPEAPVQMAADTAAPEATPTPANTEAPAPATTSAEPQKGLSDEDMQGIAKWVTETVNKAVSDAMAAYDQKMKGEMAKMRREIPIETQVKMLNEQPRSTYERLKAFGAAGAAGFQKGDDEFVEKGTNLPTAPDDPVNQLMTTLGFAGLS